MGNVADKILAQVFDISQFPYHPVKILHDFAHFVPAIVIYRNVKIALPNLFNCGIEPLDRFGGMADGKNAADACNTRAKEQRL